MPEPPLEKKFAILSQICRAQHFAWREAVRQLFPEADPEAVVTRMWEVTGVETARAYLDRLDPKKPLPPQVAASIVWSSRCMGEDAVVEAGEGDQEAYVRHKRCPWFDWAKRLDLLAEDRTGCDRWFQATLEEINRGLGTTLRVETQKTLPDGDDSCLRRIWVEPEGEPGDD